MIFTFSNIYHIFFTKAYFTLCVFFYGVGADDANGFALGTPKSDL